MTDDRQVVPLPDRLPEIPVDERPPVARMTRLELVRHGLLAVPNLVKLLYRLMRDSRLPIRRKAVVAAASVYLLSPIDLVPEILMPVLGQLDDLLIVVFAIHHLMAAAEPEVVAEYWDGNEDTLELVTAFLAWGAEFVPPPLRRVLGR